MLRALSRTLLRPVTDYIPVLAMLLFLGAMFWAKAQDPFSRKWFTLKSQDHGSFRCVAILPKPIRPRPVVIYVHSSGGDLMHDGFELRQMAELNLAVVGIEYDQTNQVVFSDEFKTLLEYLNCQEWANTNAVAWIGFGLGADRMLGFALEDPPHQPKLLVQVNEAWLALTNASDQKLARLRCPVWLVHGDDEISPLDDSKRFAAELQSNGVPVELSVLRGVWRGLSWERGVDFRCLGEHCLVQLLGKEAWRNYQSIAQWQAEAPSLVWFWLPAVGWSIGWFFWKRKTKPIPTKNVRLRWHEVTLRWLAAILAVWALIETSLHVIPPHFPVSDKTLNLARRYSVQPKERADFEHLAAQPIWEGQKLRTLLDHVELAGYNRQLIDWKLSDDIYRNCVLSPVIAPSTLNSRLTTDVNWRRPLWEEFYPRIRHESSPEDAARIVVQHLRARVSVLDMPNLPRAIPDIWRRQLSDEAGFEIIYVAALRSVGVPARLDAKGQAELFAGEKWHQAPRPITYMAF